VRTLRGTLAAAVTVATSAALAACGSGTITERDPAAADAALPSPPDGAPASTPPDAAAPPDAAPPPPPPPRLIGYTGSGATRGAAADHGALNIGHQLSVTRAGVTLRDLGVWDLGADGLARAHTVTLFALDHLGENAHATAVPGGSVVVPAGTQAPLEDGFRFAALPAPLALAPGSYAVIAYDLGSDDAYGDGGNLPRTTTGVEHGAFVPFQFVSAASPAFPVGGDSGHTSSVSFRYENGGARPLAILPLGDSITWGWNGSDAGYRAPLAARLDAAGVAAQLVGTADDHGGTLPPDERHHEGHPGWVISAGSSGRHGLMEHLPAWLGPGGVHPDVVLLMIGTNDVDLGYDLANAGARLDALLARIVALAPGARVIVAQLVPVGDTGEDARAVSYNQVVVQTVTQHRAAGENVRLVDMHAALGPGDLSDKLHPNDAGYAKMAAVWFDAIVAP
jgi:lysophospholipase L1-like esterase